MAFSPRRTDLIMDLHETWNIQITCHDDPDGTIVSDLTGASISIAIADLTGLTVMTQAGVILNPSVSGTALIQITPTAQIAAAIAIGRYTYTIRIVRADTTISDQAYGNLTVRGTEYN